MRLHYKALLYLISLILVAILICVKLPFFKPLQSIKQTLTMQNDVHRRFEMAADNVVVQTNLTSKLINEQVKRDIQINQQPNASPTNSATRQESDISLNVEKPKILRVVSLRDSGPNSAGKNENENFRQFSEEKKEYKNSSKNINNIVPQDTNNEDVWQAHPNNNINNVNGSHFKKGTNSYNVNHKSYKNNGNVDGSNYINNNKVDIPYMKISLNNNNMHSSNQKSNINNNMDSSNQKSNINNNMDSSNQQSYINNSNMDSSNQKSNINNKNMHSAHMKSNINKDNMDSSNQKSTINNSNMDSSNQQSNINNSNMDRSNQKNNINITNMDSSNQKRNINKVNMDSPNQKSNINNDDIHQERYNDDNMRNFAEQSSKTPMPHHKEVEISNSIYLHSTPSSSKVSSLNKKQTRNTKNTLTNQSTKSFYDNQVSYNSLPSQVNINDHHIPHDVTVSQPMGKMRNNQTHKKLTEKSKNLIDSKVTHETVNSHLTHNQITNKTKPLINKSINQIANKTKPLINKSMTPTKLIVSRDLQFILEGIDNSVSLNQQQQILKAKQELFVNDEKTSHFKTHAMNASKSRSTDFNRLVPETRSKMCISKYSNNYIASWLYKKVSIVIPYHNEEYSIFLRGLHSVYSRTPSYLLREVILVDDNSTFANLKVPFENYVKHFPKLKLYRTYKREGLIRSRLLGAMVTSGDVLVFLDAHVECQTAWLEPLLDVVNNIPTGIAIPTVDSINSLTMQYQLWSRKQYGTFSWELDYVWKDILWNDIPSDITAPIKSATMIGCALAITRDNFFRLGSYDEDMYIWGGENLELSFRTWMCGGGLHIAPCSHVGHLFRAYLPYRFPTGDGIINKNLQRVAETWMEKFKQYYYATTTKVISFTEKDKQSLRSRIDYVKSMTCKPFEWYLENIAKGVDIPSNDSRLFGQLKNIGTYTCLIYSRNFLELEQCSVLHTAQTFYLDNQGHLVHYRSNLCISLDLTTNKTITMSKCEANSSVQKWLFDPIAPHHIKKRLYGVDTRRPMGSFRLQFGGYNLCLAAGGVVKDCSDTKSYTQYWIFTHKINRDRIISVFQKT